MSTTQHDVDSGTSWGGPADMSAWEAVMWRAEGDLRTRSTGVIVEILDGEPDWERLVRVHESACARIPRLRERVIDPSLPLVAPAWSPDPHFDLSYHLQHLRLPREGSEEELFALAASVATRPIDPLRPPWEAVLVSGLTGGRAAYLFKVHHAMTDGLGLLQLVDLIHDHTREPGRERTGAPSSERRVETPSGLLANRVLERIAAGPGEALHRSVNLVGRLAADPVRTTVGAVRFGASLRRMLTPPGVDRSPVLRDGGFGYRFLAHDVPLTELKAAGKAVGGSVNDAFLAALLGAFRRYHEHLGATVDLLPMAVPVSLRTDHDALGGNKFAAARFAAPVGEPDPAVRIAAIRSFMTEARKEPAIGFLDLIAPVLSRLPGGLLTEIAGSMTGVTDLQASNMAGIGRTLYLAGAEVTRIYPMGPRPGVAAMVTMLSYRGNCCVGVNLDPDAIKDVDVFADCLAGGFEEVLALGR